MTGSQQQLRQGDVVAKKYEIDALVGEGPIGTTYTARNLSSGKKVALKVIHGPSVGMAVAQGVVQRIQAARADALVPVLDSGEHAGQLFVVSEVFEGETLRRMLDSYAGERKSFSLQEACQIVVRVLEAVEAAHAAGLVHRQIKPANVLVQSRAVGPGQGKMVRTIKLNTLGFSELIQPATLEERLADGVDRKYMAPELSSPASGGTIQSDLYSVGVIFYELLCGQPPMGTYLSPTQIRDDLPKHVDDIVDIALGGQAEDRYPSARDMINDIQRAFTDDDKPSARLPVRTVAMIVGGSVMALLALGAFLVLNDPAEKAARADQAQRARIIKENPVNAALQEAKAKGHTNTVFIPEGTFIRGRMRGESPQVVQATEPEAVEEKVAGFYIDMFEWPNELGGNPPVRVKYDDAAALCASKGKRLCTAVEWERACKGPEMQVYGYGDTFNADTCGTRPGGDVNNDGQLDRASGSMEKCRSGWGVYDLSGGAYEWTSSAGRNGKFRVLKGGKLSEAPASGSRCAYGLDQNPTLADASISFRCCMDDGAAPDAAPPDPAAPADPAAPVAAAAPAAPTP